MLHGSSASVFMGPASATATLAPAASFSFPSFGPATAPPSSSQQQFRAPTVRPHLGVAASSGGRGSSASDAQAARMDAAEAASQHVPPGVGPTAFLHSSAVHSMDNSHGALQVLASAQSLAVEETAAAAAHTRKQQRRAQRIRRCRVEDDDSEGEAAESGAGSGGHRPSSRQRIQSPSSHCSDSSAECVLSFETTQPHRGRGGAAREAALRSTAAVVAYLNNKKWECGNCDKYCGW